MKADDKYNLKYPGFCPGCHGENYEVETDGYDGEAGTRFVKSYTCFTCGCRWEEVYDARPLEVFIDRQPQEGHVAQLEPEAIDPDSPVGKHLAHPGTPRL